MSGGISYVRIFTTWNACLCAYESMHAWCVVIISYLIILLYLNKAGNKAMYIETLT